MNLFVTAIGTDCGKTLVSAVLVEALQCGYWKPVQCGKPFDVDTVSSLVSFDLAPDEYKRYILTQPISPHAAAKYEDIEIYVSDFARPKSKNPLIIEGAGGVLVPLNELETMADLAQHLADKIVLVVNHYLGSINHTLLTLESIKSRNLVLAGLVFNGKPNAASEQAILARTNAPVLFRIDKLSEITPQVIRQLAVNVPVELLLS